MTDKKDYHVLILTDEDKDRLSKIAENARKEIIKADNVEEMAFIIRVLIETFEETQNCIIPFKNRYTEPLYNYQDKGI